jgi:putative tryptophan/tyrosine transport system substrate-binding protein
MSEDAGCGALSIRATCRGCETISDLRLLISGLCPLPFALSLVGAMVFALCVIAEAQQPKKLPRLGYLVTAGDPGNLDVPDKAFRQGLRDLGYVEGENILVEYRYLEGKRDRIPSLVTELVQLKVDVLVASTPPAIRAAKEATKTIPIVMVTTNDPVTTGIVDSLARPGGNITGLTSSPGT